MRVRISYGVEIEDVPEQASNLGYNALIELKDAVRSLERTIEHIEGSETEFSLQMNAIEKIRLKLSKADATLIDTSAILEGLQEFYNGEDNVPERRPTVDPSGDPAEQT